MRGRKPKPTSLRRLQGNPGKRPLPKDEPQIPIAPPSADAAPPELQGDAVAAAEWEHLAPLLRKSRTMTQADRGALIALCQQWSRYLEANGEVSKKGMVVKAPSGYPMTNPYIPIANKALGICVKLWAELGLTPSSRSRVTASGSDPDADQFAEFDDAPTLPTAH